MSKQAELEIIEQLYAVATTPEVYDDFMRLMVKGD